MDLSEHLSLARAIGQAKAKSKRERQVFELWWRSTGSEYVVGWQALAQLLGIKESTLAVRLSSTKNAYSVVRTNPVHGEQDVLIISRVSAVKAETLKKRGRKAKAVDWERLGTQAPGYKSGYGTNLAHTAKDCAENPKSQYNEKQ
jgi:hypothetical protein